MVRYLLALAGSGGGGRERRERERERERDRMIENSRTLENQTIAWLTMIDQLWT